MCLLALSSSYVGPSQLDCHQRQQLHWPYFSSDINSHIFKTDVPRTISCFGVLAKLSRLPSVTIDKCCHHYLPDFSSEETLHRFWFNIPQISFTFHSSGVKVTVQVLLKLDEKATYPEFHSSWHCPLCPPCCLGYLCRSDIFYLSYVSKCPRLLMGRKTNEAKTYPSSMLLALDNHSC